METLRSPISYTEGDVRLRYWQAHGLLVNAQPQESTLTNQWVVGPWPSGARIGRPLARQLQRRYVGGCPSRLRCSAFFRDRSERVAPWSCPLGPEHDHDPSAFNTEFALQLGACWAGPLFIAALDTRKESSRADRSITRCAVQDLQVLFFWAPTVP